MSSNKKQSSNAVEKITAMLAKSNLLLSKTAESLAMAKAKYEGLKSQAATGSVDTELFEKSKVELIQYMKLRKIAIESNQDLRKSIEKKMVASGLNLQKIRAGKVPGSPRSPTVKLQRSQIDKKAEAPKSQLSQDNPARGEENYDLTWNDLEIPAKINEQAKEVETQSSEELFNFKKPNTSRVKPRKIVDSDEEMPEIDARQPLRRRLNAISDSSDDETSPEVKPNVRKPRKIKKDDHGIFDVSTDESGGEEADTVAIDDVADATKQSSVSKAVGVQAAKFVNNNTQREKPHISYIISEGEEDDNDTQDYSQASAQENGDDDDDFVGSGSSSDMVSDREDSGDDDLTKKKKKKAKKSVIRDKNVDSIAQKYMAELDESQQAGPSTSYHNAPMPKQFTVNTLKEIHDTLNKRPNEDVLEDAPDFLDCTLMRHQRHGLKFMRWREGQKGCRGGILADDMGLGKTLTTIALILKQLQIERSQNFGAPQPSGWIAQGRLIAGGTLIVCPASLINQWEAEIEAKVMSGQLSCLVFHGANRPSKVAVIAKYDVVITTYHTLANQWSEIRSRYGPLYKIKYKRVVLDEGHIIRNPKTSFANSVWDIEADCRWVLSGTPIQNKEFDLFAVIKFLRCHPFDSLEYWKEHVPTPSKKRPYQPSTKLQTLLKSILLRRTKQGLEELGQIPPMPKKEVVQINFQLDKEERNVYNRLMTYSQTVFAKFLAQQKDKHGSYIYNENNFDETFRKFFNKYNKKGDKVHGSRILVLLLRLRQATCHPSLIKAMVEETDLEPIMMGNQPNVGVDDEEMGPHFDLIRKLVQDKAPDSNSEDFDSQGDFWNVDNEIFNGNRPSSKMIRMLEILEGVLKENNKVIIVSQWVVHLEIIKRMLVCHGITYCEFTGKVPVAQRNQVVQNFHDPEAGIQVMLLSLACGGVGLNLVGANVMFIMDLHWNPQLENQGQDRIYRFGQKKNVQIFKFICEESIEESVLELQKGKLQIADSLLTGSRMTAANRLTLNDLMALFGVKAAP